MAPSENPGPRFLFLGDHAWYAQEPQPGFTKATVAAWQAALETRRLGNWLTARQVQAVQHAPDATTRKSRRDGAIQR